MSFARDLLKKAAGDLTLTGNRKYHGPNATYMELANRNVLTSTGYRNVYKDKRHNTFRGRVVFNGQKYHLGAFVRADRADVAVRLFKYWLKEGYRDIPTGKDMTYVYFDPDR